MRDNVITILCSGVALGVYIPGLLLRDELRKKGYNVEVEILEDTYDKEVLDKLDDAKKQFHANPRLAIKAHQYPQNMMNPLDEQQKELLFQKWKREGRVRFIIFSGFWVPVIKEYLQTHGIEHKYIDCVHMDAITSSSWKCGDCGCTRFNHIWPFSYEKQRIQCMFDLRLASDDSGKEKRKQRILCHGGGWGMGDYSMGILENRIPTNTIFYFRDEILPSTNSSHNYYLDQTWHPWDLKEGEFTYPRMYGIDTTGNIAAIVSSDGHPIFKILENSAAILGKPGGATLLDSYETNTPVIFRPAVGQYENCNAALWISLGFGIQYDDFVSTGPSIDRLHEMSNNIKRSKHNIECVEELLCSLKQI